MRSSEVLQGLLARVRGSERNGIARARGTRMIGDADTIQRLLTQPGTWAVVGLSSNPRRDALGVARVLRRLGKAVIPIHPLAEPVFGEPAYRSLADVPDRHLRRCRRLLCELAARGFRGRRSHCTARQTPDSRGLASAQCGGRGCRRKSSRRRARRGDGRVPRHRGAGPWAPDHLTLDVGADGAAFQRKIAAGGRWRDDRGRRSDRLTGNRDAPFGPWSDGCAAATVKPGPHVAFSRSQGSSQVDREGMP